jgi:hypothetical protein
MGSGVDGGGATDAPTAAAPATVEAGVTTVADVGGTAGLCGTAVSTEDVIAGPSRCAERRGSHHITAANTTIPMKSETSQPAPNIMNKRNAIRPTARAVIQALAEGFEPCIVVPPF